MQQITLIGRVGKKPEIHESKDGKKTKIVTFSVATNEKWKSKDGKRGESVTWHNIIGYRNMATICENYVEKGMQVGILGVITKSMFTDTKEVKRVNVQVRIDKIEFLSAPKKVLEKCPHCGGTLIEDANLFDGEISEDEPLGVGKK